MAKENSVSETIVLTFIENLGSRLTEAQQEEIVHFVDVVEYGLALETLGYLLIEEHTKIPQSVKTELITLGKEWKLQEDAFSDIPVES